MTTLNTGASIERSAMQPVVNQDFTRLEVIKISQAEYDALPVKSESVLYVIVG